MRDFELSLGEPIAFVPRQAPRLPTPPRRRDWLEQIAAAAIVVAGGARLGLTLAMHRPLGSFFTVLFLWASLLAAMNFLSQGKPHPEPLFARADSAATRQVKQAAEAKLDDVIAALAGPSSEARPVKNGPQKNPSADNGANAPVEQVQRELARLGLYTGAIDGISGSRTEAAVRVYEKKAGLTPSGKPSAALLAHMRGEALASPSLPRTDARGDGAAGQGRTAAVQRRLADMAYYRGRPSGNATPETRLAIERFQRDRGLKASGEIDEDLIGELVALGGPLR